MPQSQEYPGRKERLPVIVGANGLVHESEQPRGVVLHLDVDVELDVLVLRLCATLRTGRGSGVRKRTLMSSSTVSWNVGIACFGSFFVRTCSIPSTPYQLRSLISPMNGEDGSV